MIVLKIEKIRIECILENLIGEYKCIHKKLFLKGSSSYYNFVKVKIICGSRIIASPDMQSLFLFLL